MDWEDLNHGLFTALRIQKIGMSAVLALIAITSPVWGMLAIAAIDHRWPFLHRLGRLLRFPVD